MGAGAERMRDMVAMRRGGASLQVIAEKYDLTRERVRQILVKSGEEGMAGWRASPRFRTPRVNVPCPTCGKIIVRLQTDRVRHCSIRCVQAPRKSLSDSAAAALVQSVIQRRAAGDTWAECAATHGYDCSKSGCWKFHERITKWAGRIGLAAELAKVKGWSPRQIERLRERNRERQA